jgi:CubicO group peptidase (beta-lactamase class C family)
VGETYQYSTINYSVLGLIVQTVAGRSYEDYVQTQIFEPLQMRNSFTAEDAAKEHGLATGYNYWFGRPRAADLPYNRGLAPAGYLIATAEDMTHYLIAQLNDGRFGGDSVLSAAGIDQLHEPGPVTSDSDTFYGMGWFVGPINGIEAIHHQGETFNYHANAVLIPGSHKGVIVLMNAQNSVDLFTNDRMGTISEGVTSLIEGNDPPSPPSNVAAFVAHAALFGLILFQAQAVTRSSLALWRQRRDGGPAQSRVRIGLSLVLSLAWALVILVLVPRQLGLSLLVAAQGFPDFAYILLVSAVVALGWGIVKAIWASWMLWRPRRAYVGA